MLPDDLALDSLHVGRLSRECRVFSVGECTCKDALIVIYIAITKALLGYKMRSMSGTTNHVTVLQAGQLP